MQKIVFTLLTLIALGSSSAFAQFGSGGYWGGSSGGYWSNNTGGSVTYRGSDYGTADARSVQQVVTGRVEDMRVVTISTRGQASQYIGAGLGGAVGAIAARKVGNGSGKQIASLVGGALGALAGQAIGEHVGREERQALEIIVALDRGNVIAVTQEIDQDAASLRPGDRVRLVSGSVTRVVKMGRLM